MQSRLDRYLIWELCKATLVSSVVSILVLLGLQALRLSDLVIRYGLEARFIAKMLLGLAVSFCPLVVPIAFLFALLLVFSRMSVDREFVAMQAMGRSPKRLMAPCLVFGVFMTLLSFYLSFSLGPAGNRSFEKSIDEAFKTKVASVLRSGTFSEGFLNMVVFVENVDPVTQRLDKVFIFDETNFQNPVVISSRQGVWEQNSKEGLGVLRLMEGTLISQDILEMAVRRLHFDEYRVFADFTREAGRAQNSPPSWGWDKLQEYRREHKIKQDTDPRPVWIEIARRFGISLACLLFVPLCFSISLDNRRTVKSQAVLSGLLVLVLYWTLYFSIVTLVLKSRLPIMERSELLVWGFLWIPNFALLIAGLAAYHYKARLKI